MPSVRPRLLLVNLVWHALAADALRTRRDASARTVEKSVANVLSAERHRKLFHKCLRYLFSDPEE